MSALGGEEVGEQAAGGGDEWPLDANARDRSDLADLAERLPDSEASFAREPASWSNPPGANPPDAAPTPASARPRARCQAPCGPVPMLCTIVTSGLALVWVVTIASLDPAARRELFAGRPDAAMEAWASYKSSDEEFGALFAKPLPPGERERRLNATDPVVDIADLVPTRAGGPRSWGIDRINQPGLPLDNRYRPRLEGDGVHVFVLDTGVLPSHAEFEDRIGAGANCVDGDGCDARLPTTDRHGHGTHVACTVGSDEYGVASRVTIHPVKVLDDSGSGSVLSVVAGMRWVASAVEAHGLLGRSVAVMSLGSARDEFVNEAADALVETGVPTLVAAGNEGEDACGFSPASARGVITVGATDARDRLPGFSNWGRCVDILAPGAAINSCDLAHMTASATMSGTSQSAPHVAGVVAQLLQAALLRGELLTPAQVKAQLLELATRGAVAGADERGTANVLLAVPEAAAGDATAGPAALMLVVFAVGGACALLSRRGGAGRGPKWGVQGGPNGNREMV